MPPAAICDCTASSSRYDHSKCTNELIEQRDLSNIDFSLSVVLIQRIIKVQEMVNAASNFVQHPQVINGFRDLMVDIWGENGRAARSAVGMGSLPGNIAVEIEAILELHE